MPKLIRIESGSETELQNAIDNIEGRATQRTVSAYDVIRHVEAVEHRLDVLGVPNRARAGITTVVNGSAMLPRAYGYSAHATFVTIRRNGAGWRFVKAKRTWNRALSRELIDLPFTVAKLGSWAVTSAWSAENLTTAA
ncbi:hypothetical protein QN345_03515 [Cryobacterium sp. 10I1]|uniref:hypothetical protein n=1 Tax=unclassified Cryobacterium TaxID=2649013 RepID=UPI002AB3BF64|nr:MULTISPECIES: hypothetical protein [unclassified Cryobacterium]MDY7540860.1 hypothetical protein [Cryobacterium sp. 5B3]MEA9999824.1 hypothetical protein [Cryobacterium sp. RTS3]MEB0002462.1 hypothetical protein [Cryobacterium sp. RTC2.1]MEB0201290.1 hypothetical protein [Cryobacterium sp. 5I3]MEB0266611.1 hypothetical protein [Cryobacterium sp. 10I5]